MSEFQNYYGYIGDQAKMFVEEHLDDVIAEIRDGNTDVYDFLNDSKIHEWVDNDFIYVDLVDCANIIEQSDNVETDWGLWEGLEPKKAIEAQAFYTYRADLWHSAKDILEEELNAHLSSLEDDLETLRHEATDIEDEEEQEERDEEIEALEDVIENFENAIEGL